MEQYKNTDSGGASTSKSKNASPVTSAEENQIDQSESVGENQDCVGGQKCSGFGHCSPIKDSPSPNEKGYNLQGGLNITLCLISTIDYFMNSISANSYGRN